MKVNRRKQIAYLEIMSWRAAINGEHYYGTIKFGSEIWESLTFPMTEKQAELLNEKDGEGSDWKAGEKTNRYETIQAVERDAVIFFHERLESMGAKILCVGESANIQPMKVIAFSHGYGNIALQFTQLFDEGNFCYWNFAKSEDEKILDEISNRWKKLLEE